MELEEAPSVRHFPGIPHVSHIHHQDAAFCAPVLDLDDVEDIRPAVNFAMVFLASLGAFVAGGETGASKVEGKSVGETIVSNGLAFSLFMRVAL